MWGEKKLKRKKKHAGLGRKITGWQGLTKAFLSEGGSGATEGAQVREKWFFRIEHQDAKKVEIAKGSPVGGENGKTYVNGGQGDSKNRPTTEAKNRDKIRFTKRVGGEKTGTTVKGKKMDNVG